jgi:predicted permease
VEVEGYPEDYALRQTASLRFVSPGFFSVMGIPMLMGRDVGDLDTPDSLFVAVVSDSFVRKFWPGENPLGRRFDFGNHQRTVVGVVGNIRVRGLERSSEPQVYMPYRQHNENVSTWYAPKDLVVRASGNTAALAPALRRIIREADPQQPISSVRMFADIIEEQTAPRRVQASVLGAFALVAFLLAAIGIHGLLSFAVSNRTQEIGVRIALGAQRSDILGMVMRDGIVLAAIGIVVGVAFAYGAGLELQSLLAGVHPGDAPTFLSAVVLCLVMTMAGSLIPALRAVRVDPTTAIRTE